MDMSFPQRIRCGLIEATFGVVSKVGSILCFRSEFAAASLKLGPLPSTFDSANGFRSEFAAASLKHRTVVEFRHGCVSFRSEFAAASLKPRWRTVPPALPRRFPQRIRCGLIEAAPANDPYAAASPSFRSEFAAASLKRRHEHPHDLRHRRFRSEFAAASLKLHRIANGSTMTVRFRSEFAAASLKRVGVGKRLSQHQEFPQRIRCGLIEAALATCAPMRCCSVSAANSLRPH